MPAFSFEKIPDAREPNTGEIDEQGGSFNRQGMPRGSVVFLLWIGAALGIMVVGLIAHASGL